MRSFPFIQSISIMFCFDCARKSDDDDIHTFKKIEDYNQLGWRFINSIFKRQIQSQKKTYQKQLKSSFNIHQATNIFQIRGEYFLHTFICKKKYNAKWANGRRACRTTVEFIEKGANMKRPFGIGMCVLFFFLFLAF